jgi:serine/threonine protein kinase
MPPPNDDREPWISLIESQLTICDRFTDITRIDPNAGGGNFSFVFSAKDTHSKKGRVVILKVYNPLGGDPYRRECFEREGEILKDLVGQRNILPLVKELTTFNISVNGIPFPISLYASHMAKCSVADYIYSQQRDPIKSIQFFREICKGVQRIRRKEICHRDLKPEQFLIFSSGYICLADFGTARYFGAAGRPIRPSYSAPSGDLRYTAPELLAGLHFSDYHNYAADVYSLGCILFELYAKSVLTLNLLTGTEIQHLIDLFALVPENDRIKVFEEFVPTLASSRSLPSVSRFDNSIPVSAAHEIDKLYMSMAQLDPRSRANDFEHIFLRINIIEKILRNIKQYESWRALRAQRRRG